MQIDWDLEHFSSSEPMADSLFFVQIEWTLRGPLTSEIQYFAKRQPCGIWEEKQKAAEIPLNYYKQGNFSSRQAAWKVVSV